MNAPTLLVPKYVENLATIAQFHGLRTRFYVDTRAQQKPADPLEYFLAAEWTGTKAQVLALGVLTPAVAKVLQYFPCNGREFRVPTSSSSRDLPILDGTISTEGEAVRLLLDFGEVPRSIHWQGDIQVMRYAGAIAYHGTDAALLAAKVCSTKQLPRGLRTGRATRGAWGDYSQPETAARRQLDGSYVFRTETPEAVAIREADYMQWKADKEAESAAAIAAYRRGQDEPAPIAPKPKPSYLRLVVDNDSDEREVTVQ